MVALIAAADFIAPPAVRPTDGAENVPLKLTIGISVSPRPQVTTGVTARARPSVRRFTVPVAIRLYFAVSIAALCSDVRMPSFIGTRTAMHLTSVFGSVF